MKNIILFFAIVFSVVLSSPATRNISRSKVLKEDTTLRNTMLLSGTVPGFTNPFYLTTDGVAMLNVGKLITGKFYYSSPLNSKTDVFYFYSGNIETLEIIPITEVKEVTFKSKGGLKYTYILEGECLYRILDDGTKEKLDTHVLRTLK